MSKRINVQYFALLREERGTSMETIEADAATTGDLYEDLAKEHGFSLGRDQLKVAVNEEYADWNRLLESGDTIVFVPPVAGG